MVLGGMSFNRNSLLRRGSGVGPLSDRELRRELRRNNSIKGMTSDGDCYSEKTADVSEEAQAGEAAEHKRALGSTPRRLWQAK